MSEWLKEHAWKLNPLARADAHQIAPTLSRSTTSRNNDLLQRVPVNDGVAPGFRGVCDTVLTQNPNALRAMRSGVRSCALLPSTAVTYHVWCAFEYCHSALSSVRM